MKTIKFMFAALAMTFAMNASAQDGHFTADLKVGGVAGAGGFGAGVGYQKNLTEFEGCTLAWDVVNFEFAAPFDSPKYLDLLALKTGLRLFSPSFANDKLRAYTNLSVGYSCALVKGADVEIVYDEFGFPVDATVDESMKAKHGFGLTFGVGVQFKEKFSVGYSLQYETGWKTKCHFATFGYTF